MGTERVYMRALRRFKLITPSLMVQRLLLCCVPEFLWESIMREAVLAVLVCGALAGCGLGETASSVATGAAAQAGQAQQAAQTEARVKEQLDAAAKLDAQRRQEADAATQ
jgi:hypothetical protein